MQEDLEQNAQQSESTESIAAGETTETTTAAESTVVDSTDAKVPHKKVRTGVVVSDKMEKSVVVQVTRRVRHPLYKKYFYKSKRFMAHDETNDCNVGDTVRIKECRPLSAKKRWTVEEIVERAK